MDVALFIGLVSLGAILVLVGLAGSILPVLPGPTVSYLSLLLIHFTKIYAFPAWVLIVLALITIIILVLDYVIPLYGTKKTGGSKYGIWGSGIGLVVGMFFVGPTFGLSIVIAPFIGAVVGELISGKETNDAIKAGFGAFLGFLAGTFSKIMLCLLIGGVFTYGAIKGASVIF